MTTTPFRFRLYTAESIGAYTTVHATNQAEALADLRRQAAPWEYIAQLQGPDCSTGFFY